MVYPEIFVVLLISPCQSQFCCLKKVEMYVWLSEGGREKSSIWYIICIVWLKAHLVLHTIIMPTKITQQICHDTANIKLCDITVKFKMGLRSKGAVLSAKVWNVMRSVNSSSLHMISFVSFKAHNNSITADVAHVFDIINDCLEWATAIE